MDSNSRKQKYLDMVTDPHRFDKYQSSGGGAVAPRSAGEEDEDEWDEVDDEDGATSSAPL